ncbi:hypothetical protein MaudCBS49596_000921 [Microsporum audouinii]
MPELSEIKCSQQDCIAAIRDYYYFLTTMYLDEDLVLQPPEGGWPSITDEVMLAVGKDKTPIPFLYFADWPGVCAWIKSGQLTAEDARDASQAYMDAERVPPHVIGLTCGGAETAAVLLDTKLGVIFWPECPGGVVWDPCREEVLDDAYDYAPKNEADWRAGGGRWAIADFFEVLKYEFCKLSFVPFYSRLVREVYSVDLKEFIPMLQEIYRKHGWPNMEIYNKQKCLSEVRAELEDKFPDYIYW